MKHENIKNKNIAVIFGGQSAEAEVSRKTAGAVYKSLVSQGYKAELIEFSTDIYNKLTSFKTDIVFNAMHGAYGEDGCLQGLLECLKIPYTHSNVASSAIAMDKSLTKDVLLNHDINMADGETVLGENLARDVMEYPYVVKPVADGSSVGVHIVKSEADFDAIEIDTKQKYLVEQFIDGRELSVAVIDDKAIGVIEITPNTGVYDYKSKYTAGASEYQMPADIPEDIYKSAMDYAEASHNILGCSYISRSDIIYNEAENQLYFLEINTHPGMTENSLVPKIANYNNISFDNLVENILNNAKLHL